VFFFDQGYILFVLPAMIFALWAQGRVNSAYETYSRMYSKSGRSGYEVALSLLRNAGLGDVRVEMTEGRLSDHYDPRKRVLRLSRGIYDSPSIAAVAIAAHEVGHAVQHSVGYALLGIRNGLVPIVQFSSNAAVPLFLVGLFTNSGILMDLGIVFFMGAVVFQLITLPVEYNASQRALDMLQVSGIVGPGDVQPVGNMLNAAALTYVAGTAVAIAQVLRLMLYRNSRRR
jgi:Zn-dependent membrane protease YugP